MSYRIKRNLFTGLIMMLGLTLMLAACAPSSEPVEEEEEAPGEAEEEEAAPAEPGLN